MTTNRRGFLGACAAALGLLHPKVGMPHPHAVLRRIPAEWCDVVVFGETYRLRQGEELVVRGSGIQEVTLRLRPAGLQYWCFMCEEPAWAKWKMVQTGDTVEV